MSVKLVSSIHVYVSQTGLFHPRLRLSNWSLPSASIRLANWSLQSTSTSFKLVSSISVYVSQTGLFHRRLRLKLVSSIYVYVSQKRSLPPTSMALAAAPSLQPHQPNSSTPLTADTSNRKSAYSKKHGSSKSDKLSKVCEGSARCLPSVSHKQAPPTDTKIGKLDVYWSIEKYLRTFLTLSLNTGQ
jgi:hypothetical protein